MKLSKKYVNLWYDVGAKEILNMKLYHIYKYSDDRRRRVWT